MSLSEDFKKILNTLSINNYILIDSFILKIEKDNLDIYIVDSAINNFRLEIYQTINNQRSCISRIQPITIELIINELCNYFKQYKRIYKLKQLNDKY